MPHRLMTILGGCIFLLFSMESCHRSGTGFQPPNIIFIMADDMGVGDLGCYGQQVIQTPRIDELAGKGILFTTHYAGNTVCAPSRCSLMTGLHMGHAAIRGNRQAEPSGQWPLPDGALTVAELLKNAGYATAMIGKWGLGVEHSTGDPLRQGFDLYYGYLDQVLAHNYFPEYLLRNGEKEYLDNEVKYLDTTAWHRGLGSYSVRKNEYSHDLMTREALRFIRAHRDSLFFLYLPYTIPHDNGEETEGERQEVPDFGIYEEKAWPKERKGYAAMISRLDRDVGRIMDLLEELGLEQNTILFFTSDNGPMPDREMTAFFDSSGPFRGGKRELYEGGTRAPLIVSWKGIIDAGSRTSHLSAFWDFLPTACDLAQVPPPAGIDGISYLPTLLGEAQPEHGVLYWEFTERGGSQALREDRWKLIRNQVVSEPPGTLELYDLETDPGEERNLAGEYPGRVKELLERMEEERVESDVFPLKKTDNP
ncbi:MAG: arylsulfatase [Bacteroidales bacterium]